FNPRPGSATVASSGETLGIAVIPQGPSIAEQQFVMVLADSPRSLQLPYYAREPFTAFGDFIPSGFETDGFAAPLTFPIPGRAAPFNNIGGSRVSDIFSAAERLRLGRPVRVQVRTLPINTPQAPFAFVQLSQGGGRIDVTSGGKLLGNAAGFLDQAWQSLDPSNPVTYLVKPTAFAGGIGSFGGDVRVAAGGSITDIGIASTGGQQVTTIAGRTERVLVPRGGGRTEVTSGDDVAGLVVLNRRGEVNISSGGSIIDGSRVQTRSPGLRPGAVGPTTDVLVYSPRDVVQLFNSVRTNDATVNIVAVGSAKVETQIVDVPESINPFAPPFADSVLTSGSSLSILANGSVETSYSGPALRLTSITGDILLTTPAAPDGTTGFVNFGRSGPATIFLLPSSKGALELFAGNSLAPVSILMRDDLLPVPG
ncbi:MAG: hypothetical protein ACRC1J_08550, partial [Sandaracinobacteroides sp.]